LRLSGRLPGREARSRRTTTRKGWSGLSTCARQEALAIQHDSTAGEYGAETWENGSWATNGNVGVWSEISVDEDLGLVYLPVENAHG